MRLTDTDHSLKAGARGPVLLQDHHLREKITRFDHERIPERVVHARGAAAHGVFRGHGTATGVTKARFLAEGVETEVFVRFSRMLGSRGSAQPDIVHAAEPHPDRDRHAKPLGGWDGASRTLEAAGCAPDSAGTVLSDDLQAVVEGVTALLTRHRVWDRFPPARRQRLTD